MVFHVHRVVSIVAVDEDGVQGPQSIVTVRFDRTCRVFPDSGILTLTSQSDVDSLGVCTSLGGIRVDLLGGSTIDPIISLLPMTHITVRILNRMN